MLIDLAHNVDFSLDTPVFKTLFLASVHATFYSFKCFDEERTSVEKGGDEVWIGEKFQSNPEIAGSPRNSFRASLILVCRR